ncbi:hypothetical protein BJ508DRAFT_323335 [Ascobolus immersus RN42]|uniref:Uncharacterized protein n=1 Tax=Ascobolus immersus RN42 TaxID=1160509 RepID=A0A3N4IH73_ASCIM|nr:hypothetical protein BJ508DRAFT_323335 [Ascobolus immersus RN42]
MPHATTPPNQQSTFPARLLLHLAALEAHKEVPIDIPSPQLPRHILRPWVPQRLFFITSQLRSIFHAAPLPFYPLFHIHDQHLFPVYLSENLQPAKATGFVVEEDACGGKVLVKTRDGGGTVEGFMYLADYQDVGFTGRCVEALEGLGGGWQLVETEVEVLGEMIAAVCICLKSEKDNRSRFGSLDKIKENTC